MSENTYTISKHSKERYAERILGKTDANEIQKFIAQQEDKIITDINKLINYGEIIYSGKQTQKDGKINIIDVYLKDTWVVLVDNKNKNVITLYKIDLGCDDEFNCQYVTKMLEKIKANKETLDQVKETVEQESASYRQMITAAAEQIKEYRAMIKNLENLCVGYQTIIDNNAVKISQANIEVTNVVNKLIGKKEF